MCNKIYFIFEILLFIDLVDMVVIVKDCEIDLSELKVIFMYLELYNFFLFEIMEI